MKTSKRPYVMTARSAKAEATKERIRQSAIELYGEGSLEAFTLDEVARRAQTTVQTVLRIYGSKANLIVEALAAFSPKGLSMMQPRPGDVGAAVATIFDVYESIGDMIVQQLGDEHRLPGLKADLDHGRQSHGEWVTTVFAPQLQRARGKARTQLYHGLMVATDVYVWKLLRRDQQLERAAAEAIMRRMIDSLIQPAE